MTVKHPVKCHAFLISNADPTKEPIVWGIYSSVELGWNSIKETKELDPELITVHDFWLDDLVDCKEERSY